MRTVERAHGAPGDHTLDGMMKHARAVLVVAGAAALAACASASSGRGAGNVAAARSLQGPPALDAITEADLRRDLFAMAGDEMRGREAGTLDEMRASVWLAERARDAGLEPAGDDGTFFQFWPMRRTRLSDASTITVAGVPLVLWSDVVVTTPVTTTVDLPLAFVGSTLADGDAASLQGKAVVSVIEAPANPPRPTMSLYPYRYALAAVRQQSARLIQRGAAAVILVSDSIADAPMAFGFGGVAMARGRYGLDTAGAAAAAQPRNAPGVPVLWVRRSMLDALRGAAVSNGRLTAELMVESYSYPSVNIVGRIPGSDPARRNEYVLFSGHQDHDGVRYPIAGDSIWNGADDNASVSVALLAIARAFKRLPAARSALFVWHGAEERGLLGSNWYARHPTVPKGSIVAVLNGDMIGRNDSDSAALLGVQPPHLNSRALVEAALRANDAITQFKLDTLWDRPTHNEGWYFRSDHLPYARAGIPAIFFSTLLHPDYHTPRDEPSRIDIAKLARMAQWMYATGWAIGEAPARPDVVPGFKLER